MEISDVTPAGPAASETQRQQIKALAQQFESMLVAQMLREMRQSMLSDEERGLGSETMTDTIDSQLALRLSACGRVGLAQFLVGAFDRQIQSSPSSGPSEVEPRPAPETASDVSSPSASVQTAALLPAGEVVSRFGWRSDPITGQTRFHAGTDVRMAYGQDVRAAAGGRVASVGQQGGYGLTVVVDHGGGVQTRYAHLSAAPVHAGDVVDTGQVIAQSGNSGRSTGPHLHFEVLKGGKPVDPEAMAGLLAGH